MEPQERQDGLYALVDTLHVHFGGRWADAWLLPQEHSSSLHVGIVDPTPEDVRFAADRARETGWHLTIHGVRYSKEELEQLKERILDVLMVPAPDSPIISCGFTASANAVRVELTRLDDDVIARMLELAPADALSFAVNPGARYVPL
jgi:hypothetical protein